MNKNLSLLQDEILAVKAKSKEMKCADVEQIVNTLGVNGLAEVLPDRLYHAAGQKIGSMITAAPRTREQLTQVYDTLNRISNYQVMPVPERRTGFIHGAIWHTIGTNEGDMTNVSWTDFMEYMCPWAPLEFAQDCLHGIGHGGIVKGSNLGFGGANSIHYTPCDVGIPFTNKTMLYEAPRMCESAPSSFGKRLCAMGFFHSVAEYYDLDGINRDVDHPLWPCNGDTMFETHEWGPAYCWLYRWMWDAQVVGVNFHALGRHPIAYRFDYFNSIPGHLGRLCFVTPMQKEKNTVGCIFGLSAIYFVFPFGFQKLMTNPGDSLVVWCSNFVDPARPKPEDAQRWLACISGATEWYYGGIARIAAAPKIARQGICKALLDVEWQPQSLRECAHRVCMIGAVKSHAGWIPDKVSNEFTMTHKMGIFGTFQDPQQEHWDQWWPQEWNSSEYKWWPLDLQSCLNHCPGVSEWIESFNGLKMLRKPVAASTSQVESHSSRSAAISPNRMPNQPAAATENANETWMYVVLSLCALAGTSFLMGIVYARAVPATPTKGFYSEARAQP